MNKEILVYNDEGVGERCGPETFRVIQQFFSQYDVRQVDHEFVNHHDWQANTALFVMPGGRSSPHYKLLADGGNQKIAEFVRQGGKYLGICAGAYYGCARTEFAKGHATLEICREGGLGFFPGVGSGPVLGVEKFRYDRLGYHLVPLQVLGDQKPYHVLYYGGPCFVDADQCDGVDVLGRYQDQTAAIIKCQFGKGMAILSGPHIEFSHLLLTEEDLDESTDIELLKNTEQARLALFKKTIRQFDL